MSTAPPATRGISVTDHTGPAVHYESASSRGLRCSVSQKDAGFHDPSPVVASASVANDMIAGARISEAAFRTEMSTAFESWYDTLTSAGQDKVRHGWRFQHKFDIEKDSPPTS